MPDPVDEFTAGLSRLGANPERRGGLVVYQVESVAGHLPGEVIQTGVEIAELAGWPLAPPHWVHLPADLTFAHTNSQPSEQCGWVRHSRQIAGWGTDSDAAQGWLAHVRGVIGEAQ
jgi:hypothetical protein